MDPAAPMPPGAPLAAVDYAAFAAWVNAGAPRGSYSIAGDAGPDPFSAPPQCSSARMWTSGNRGSQNMNPGQPCIACHQTDPEAPLFSIAGTLYQTAHEPNNCYGGVPAAMGTPVVEITDAMGQVLMLNVLSSGNFGTQRTITPLPRARPPKRSRCSTRWRTRWSRRSATMRCSSRERRRAAGARCTFT